MDWIEIICVLPDRRGLELAEAVFDDFFPEGFSEHDPEAIRIHIESNEWDAHEFDVSLLQDASVVLTGYWPVGEGEARWEDLQSRMSEAMAKQQLPDVRWKKQHRADEDWSESWKAHFDIVHYGERIQVVPEWLEPDVPEDIVIRIEPGLAFGTGMHPTTGLCLTFLEEIIFPNATVFDIGTGSGILALAAHQLGAGRVDATDADPLSVRSAAQNAARNNSAISVYESDLLAQVHGQADVIIANIVADVIIRMLPQVEAHLLPRGLFLASGILNERATEVVTAADKEGLCLQSQRTDGDWTALLFTRATEKEAS